MKRYYCLITATALLVLGRPNVSSGGETTAQRSIYGYVRSGSAGIPYAVLYFYNAQHNYVRGAIADEGGFFYCTYMSEDAYYVVARKDGYVSEWYKNAHHISQATLLTFGTNTVIPDCHFNLVPGQAPAWANVRSSPTNAVIYVDYHPVTNLTIAAVNLGESAPRGGPQSADDPRWLYQAAHTISARLPGYPLPPPQRLPGLEADTIDRYFSTSLCEDYFVAGLCDDFHVQGLCADYFIAGICGDYFVLTQTNTGSLKIESSPSGAEVFVDAMDVPAGSTPIVVDDLFQGWHTLQLRRSGYLLPRPIRYFVVQGQTNKLTVPLNAVGSGATNLTAHLTSTPSGATVFLDYLETTNLTPAIITDLDNNALCGDRLYSVSHSFSLRKESYLTTLPRYIRSFYPEPFTQHIDLVQTPSAIGDLVWFDANTNGVLDVGEPGVSNVTVNLYDASTNWLQEATTDPDGNYCFKGLTSGTYMVEVYPPPARAFTFKDLGTNGQIDSAVWPATGRTDPIPLAYGEYNLGKDAGLKTNTISAFWFRATALTNNVYLRWLPPDRCGMLNSNVLIRYRTDQYPSNLADGLEAYIGSEPAYNKTGLTPNQTYYFTIWLSHNGIRFIEPPP